jgi:DNA polymerase-3 subunit epsilon
VNNNILVFDVETTGLPLKGTPSDDPRQPHIVQIAATVINRDTREAVDSINAIVKPSGWFVPPETTALHGISHALAVARGVPEQDVVQKFVSMHNNSVLTVAHNIQFDLQILRTAMLRYGMSRSDVDDICLKPTACTMQMSSPILNLPPTERMKAVGIHSPKSPKLEECVRHFFGEELQGAHDAFHDVNACARVYFHLIENYKF